MNDGLNREALTKFVEAMEQVEEFNIRDLIDTMPEERTINPSRGGS
jgi:hypothetical protein